MHQIEYKAQRLEAQKLQLANESDRVYDEYMEALDAKKIQYRALNPDGTPTFVDATLQLLENGNIPVDEWAGGGCSSTYFLKNGSTGELLLTKEAAKYYYGIEPSEDGTSTAGTVQNPGKFEDWLEEHKGNYSLPTTQATEQQKFEDKSKITQATLTKNSITEYVAGTNTAATWALNPQNATLDSVGVTHQTPGAYSSTNPGELGVSAPVEGQSLKLNNGPISGAQITKPIYADSYSTYGNRPAITYQERTYNDDGNDVTVTIVEHVPTVNDTKILLAEYAYTGYAFDSCKPSSFSQAYSSIEQILKSYPIIWGEYSYYDLDSNGDIVEIQGVMSKEEVLKRVGCMLSYKPYEYLDNGKTINYADVFLENSIDLGYMGYLYDTLRTFIPKSVNGYSYYAVNTIQQGNVLINTMNDIKTQLCYDIMNSDSSIKTQNAAQSILDSRRNSLGLSEEDFYQNIAILYENSSTKQNIINYLKTGNNVDMSWFNTISNNYSGYNISTTRNENLSIQEPIEAKKSQVNGYADIFNKFCYDVWNTNDESRAKNEAEIKSSVTSWLSAGGFNAGTGGALCAKFIDNYSSILNAYRSNPQKTLGEVFDTSTTAHPNSYYEIKQREVSNFTLSQGAPTGKNEITCDSVNDIATKLVWDYYQNNKTTNPNIDPNNIKTNLIGSNCKIDACDWAVINWGYKNNLISNDIVNNLVNYYNDINVYEYLDDIYEVFCEGNDISDKLDIEDNYTISMSKTQDMSITGQGATTGESTIGTAKIPTLDVIAKNFAIAYAKSKSGNEAAEDRVSETQRAEIEQKFKTKFSTMSSDANKAYLNDQVCKGNAETLQNIYDYIYGKSGATYTPGILKDSKGNDITNDHVHYNFVDVTTEPAINQYGYSYETVNVGGEVYDETSDGYKKAKADYEEQLKKYNNQQSITANGEKIKIINDGNESKYEYVRNLLTMNDVYIVEYDINTGERRDTNVSVETKLREVSDEKNLKKAEAKYEADMRQIDKKDRKYDTELAALDTERSACKNEMETLKTVAKENVDRTFKLFS